MDSKICDYLDNLKHDSLSLFRTELIKCVDGLKDEGIDYCNQQHAKLEKHLLQLSTGQITKQQFKDAIDDMKIAADAEATLAKVKTKAAAQRLSDDLTKLVMNGLIKAIPG